MKKRLAVFAAFLAAALLFPATQAAADHRHHRHHRYYRSGVSVGVGVGGYPVYRSYYYDPYYAPYDYGYYSTYPGPVYYRYPGYRYQRYYYTSRPSVSFFLGW